MSSGKTLDEFLEILKEGNFSDESHPTWEEYQEISDAMAQSAAMIQKMLQERKIIGSQLIRLTGVAARMNDLIVRQQMVIDRLTAALLVEKRKLGK
jgi:hypothetical protein